MSNEARLSAIREIANQGPAPNTFDFFEDPTGEVWAQNVFTYGEMAERLPKAVFKSLKQTIETSGELDPAVAHRVGRATARFRGTGLSLLNTPLTA